MLVFREIGVIVQLSITEGDSMRKNSTEAVRQYRLNQSELGREKREAYLTVEEWAKVKAYIKTLRE